MGDPAEVHGVCRVLQTLAGSPLGCQHALTGFPLKQLQEVNA